MMSIGVIVIISCVLTGITMVVFSGLLFVMVQSGGKGIQALFDRFFGDGNDKDKEKQQAQEAERRARPQLSSGDVIRQRAQNLDFAPQAAGQGFMAQQAYDPLASPPQATFNAQAQDPLAPPQQASFSSRETLSQSQPYQPPQQEQFGHSQSQPPFAQSSPTMPSLSSARPFDLGQQPYQPPQQPLSGNQYIQSSQQFGGQLPQPANEQQNQIQQNPPLPPIGGQQQSYQPPQQPLSGNQYGQPPQQPAGQQQPSRQQPPPPPGLGSYAPPLQRGGNIDQNTAPGLRRGRDSRRSDDRDIIYDDRDGGDFIGDLGDFLG